MPQSVRLTIATASLLAVVGLVSTVLVIADVADHDAAIRWVTSALGAREGVVRLLFTPLYLSAFVVVRAALRRDGRTREIALPVAVFTAVSLGFLCLGMSIVASIDENVDGGDVGMLLVFALAALLAWSLSRPSAKQWFDAARDRESPPAA